MTGASISELSLTLTDAGNVQHFKDNFKENNLVERITTISHQILA